MIKVNAIGEVCPRPLIMTKKALKEIENGVVEVSIDNETAKENIEKMATQLGHNFVTEKDGNIFIIKLTKEGEVEKETLGADNTVIAIASDKMGEGDPILGNILIKGFIYALTEYDVLPKTILLYNKGVLLAATNPDTIKDLKSLEDRGVEILSCGTCADFYHVKDQISVGGITNMYTILEKQMLAQKVIKP